MVLLPPRLCRVSPGLSPSPPVELNANAEARGAGELVLMAQQGSHTLRGELFPRLVNLRMAPVVSGSIFPLMGLESAPCVGSKHR